MALDVTLDEASAAEIIREQFRALRCETVCWLGEGYDSMAVLVDGEWVFRFPKRKDVEDQLRMEFRILPTLAHVLPLPIPVFRYRGSPSTTYPFQFGGYAFIPGIPAHGVAPATVAPAELATLGRFLSRLHTIPRSHFEPLDLPIWPSEVVLEECREEALNDFERVAAIAATEPLDEWVRYFRDRTPGPCIDADLAVIHADFAAEHILYDEDQAVITGVIDWSEVAIADTALDLAGLIHWGGLSSFEAVVAGYGSAAGAEQLSRARYFAACRGVGDVIFGLDHDRPEYVDGGLRALRLSIPQ
jgi:aminoglycoside phosphotransferase (APT) family kinase protein